MHKYDKKRKWWKWGDGVNGVNGEKKYKKMGYMTVRRVRGRNGVRSSRGSRSRNRNMRDSKNNRSRSYMYKRKSRVLSKTDIAVILLGLQIVVSMVGLVVVFTLQFFDHDKFLEVGNFFSGSVEEDWGEAVFVTKIIDGFDWNIDTVFGAMGGESSYIPDNLHMGRVVVSKTGVYPAGENITSAFGVRYHPITSVLDFHNGVDFAAAMDSDIVSVFGGVVTDVGFSRVYGNYITINHGGDIDTVYNHCNTVVKNIGDEVLQGEKIATVGSTGVSTGPHLHLVALADGSYINPLNLFF